MPSKWSWYSIQCRSCQEEFFSQSRLSPFLFRYQQSIDTALVTRGRRRLSTFPTLASRKAREVDCWLAKQPIVQIHYVSFPWAMDQGFTLPLSNSAAATVSVKPDRVYRFRVQCSVQEASSLRIGLLVKPAFLLHPISFLLSWSLRSCSSLRRRSPANCWRFLNDYWGEAQLGRTFLSIDNRSVKLAWWLDVVHRFNPAGCCFCPIAEIAAAQDDERRGNAFAQNSLCCVSDASIPVMPINQ